MARRIAGMLAVAGTASVAMLGITATAHAHTPVLSAVCVSDQAELVVDLRAYSDRGRNVVTITDNGKEVVKSDFAVDYRFKRRFDGKVGHTFMVAVEAWDDPSSHNGWSFRKELEVAQCVKPTTTTPKPTTTPPKPTTSTPPSSSTTGSTTTTVTTSATSVVPVAEETPLAATGASPLWALLAGAGLLGVGGGAVYVTRRRRT
jgi:LPXTG-motif cell wall-anchored protein